MANYDIDGIKNLYPTIEEINKAINKCIIDRDFKKQFNTKESKQAVIRLNSFLSVLEGIKKEYEN